MIVGKLAPAEEEVRRDLRHERALQAHAGVVPAERVARRMVAVVEPLAPERREVDPTDEGDPIVDDDELLVMTVHRSLVRVEGHRDARAANQLVAHAPHLSPIGMEERQRCAGPREHANVDPLRGVGEKLT